MYRKGNGYLDGIDWNGDTAGGTARGCCEYPARLPQIGFGYEDNNEQREKMSNLVVVAFDEPDKAEEVHLKLQKLQSENLVYLADLVVAVKDKTGRVKLHHADNLIAADEVYRGFCGSLASLIFLNAATAAASRALTDVGINDHFMKELAATLIPNSSTLFVLTRSPSPDRDRLLEELKGLGGKILITSLSHEDAARLQAALSAAKSADS